jgi:hypothetical protein
MSDFKLDIDSPFPLPTRELLQQRPDKLPYPQKRPKYRFYGNNIMKMIEKCLELAPGKERNALITLTANQMKKGFLEFNKDKVEDEVIFEHLIELSKGKLEFDLDEIKLAKTGILLKTIENDSNKVKAVKNNFKKPQPFKKPIKKKF